MSYSMQHIQQMILRNDTLYEKMKFFTKKFLDDFGTATSCFINGYKIYIYWDNIRRYHCNVWEKIICDICI